jgi:hypothetical protein
MEVYPISGPRHGPRACRKISFNCLPNVRPAPWDEHVLMVQFSLIPLAVFHCASASATVHDRPSTLHDSHGRLCYCRGEAKTLCGLEVAPLSDPFTTNSNTIIKSFLSRRNRRVSYGSIESARFRVQTGQSAHGDCMYPIWSDIGAPDASRGIRCTRRQ